MGESVVTASGYLRPLREEAKEFSENITIPVGSAKTIIDRVAELIECGSIDSNEIGWSLHSFSGLSQQQRAYSITTIIDSISWQRCARKKAARDQIFSRLIPWMAFGVVRYDTDPQKNLTRDVALSRLNWLLEDDRYLSLSSYSDSDLNEFRLITAHRLFRKSALIDIITLPDYPTENDLLKYGCDPAEDFSWYHAALSTAIRVENESKISLADMRLESQLDENIKSLRLAEERRSLISTTEGARRARSNNTELRDSLVSAIAEFFQTNHRPHHGKMWRVNKVASIIATIKTKIRHSDQLTLEALTEATNANIGASLYKIISDWPIELDDDKVALIQGIAGSVSAIQRKLQDL